jgi:hypothetical protein
VTAGWRRTWLALLVSCNAPIVFDGPNLTFDADANAPSSTADARVERAVGAAGSAGNREGGSPQLCSSDPDCRLPSLHCDTVSRSCVSCLDDTHCASGPLLRCDFALNRCVQCGSDNDCSTGQKCTAHRCLTSCQTSTTCPVEAPVCDARGLCVRCLGDADCPSATTPYCNVPSGQCVACNVQQQCTPGAPRCDPVRGVCVGCLSSANCEVGHFCSPVTNTCADD